MFCHFCGLFQSVKASFCDQCGTKRHTTVSEVTPLLLRTNEESIIHLSQNLENQ